MASKHGRTGIGRVLAEHREAQTEAAPEIAKGKKINKAQSSEYMKLGAYVPRSLHSAFATALRKVGEPDLSVAVEKALVSWIKQNKCDDVLAMFHYRSTEL